MEYPRLQQELTTIADELVSEYRTRLLERSFIKTGFLADSIHQNIFSGDDIHQIKLSLFSYWKYVERGRGPGKQPPLDAIDKWVQLSDMANVAAEEGMTTRQLAFLIARKIGREGTEGKHIFYMIFESHLDDWVSRIRTAVMQDVGNDVVATIKTLLF